jgi:hypothetical protein
MNGHERSRAFDCRRARCVQILLAVNIFIYFDFLPPSEPRAAAAVRSDSARVGTPASEPSVGSLSESVPPCNIFRPCVCICGLECVKRIIFVGET